MIHVAESLRQDIMNIRKITKIGGIALKLSSDRAKYKKLKSTKERCNVWNTW
jgi:hypothetical protein